MALEADLKPQALACVKELESKWSAMNEELPLKQDVSLDERMFNFAIPAIEYVQSTYPLLLSDPEESGMLLVMMIGKAVINSGSHSEGEVNEAMPLLNDRLRQHFTDAAPDVDARKTKQIAEAQRLAREWKPKK